MSKLYGFSVIDLEDGETVFESGTFQFYADAKQAAIDYLFGRSDHYWDMGSREESNSLEQAAMVLMRQEDSAKIYSSTINWKIRVESVDSDV